MSISFPNPYELVEIQELALEKDTKYWRLFSQIKKFLEEGSYKDYLSGIDKGLAPSLPFIQEDLKEALWVSKVSPYKRSYLGLNPEGWTHQIGIKPRRVSSFGQLWDSLWGWG